MTPANDEMSVFTAKLANNVRVNLYDKDYLSRAKRTFPFLFLASLVLLTSFFFIDLISQMQLIVFSLIAFVGLLTMYIIGKRSCIASLMGETLIFKGIDSKSTVTTLSSVRKVYTFQVFGIRITRLNYSLDGKTRSLLIFGNPTGMKASIDELIAYAKKNKKIKGKS